MIRVLLALLATLPLLAGAQVPERVIKPEIRKGDSWTYRSRNILSNSTEVYDLKVEQSDGKTIQVVATRKGDEKEFDATFTSEWNPVVSIAGVIFSPPARFFSFPMKIGDTRSVKYTSSRPRTNSPPTQYAVQVTVADWEDVTVPAGKFRAMRVVVEGTFFPPHARSAEMIRVDFWYDPEVRRWVKDVIKGPNNYEVIGELLEFKLNED